MAAAQGGLGGMTWPEAAVRAASTLIAVPVGSTEQHGPHLPLSTDTTVAVALAARLADRRSDVLVAPAVAYGASGEHAGFAGTLSIGTRALESVLIELARSADAFAGVVLISAHGGNADAVRGAVRTLHAEGRPVRAWSPGGGGDGHAGHAETSVLLALDRPSVRLEHAAAGNRTPVAQLMPALRAGGVAAVTANGVLGDPGGASADAGEALLQAWTDELVAFLGGWP